MIVGSRVGKLKTTAHITRALRSMKHILNESAKKKKKKRVDNIGTNIRVNRAENNKVLNST